MDLREIYEVIRGKIICLDLMPEKILNLSELADAYGVSRTPIKEALLLLQADGLVLNHESRFMVTPLSINRIKDITEVRSVLEVQASVWAMQRMTSKDLTDLSQIKEEIMQPKTSKNNKKMLKIDSEFHSLIYRATRNNQLAGMLEGLLRHYTRFWLSNPHNVGWRRFFRDTLKIIQAIEKKDEAKLREAATNHIESSVEDLVAYFSNSGFKTS